MERPVLLLLIITYLLLSYSGREVFYHLFDHLSRFERTILSLHDDKKYTYEQIGSQLGYHRDTIWKKRKQIKSKLTKLLSAPN